MRKNQLLLILFAQIILKMYLCAYMFYNIQW